MRKLLAGAFAALLVGIGLVWTQPSGAWLAQVPTAAAYQAPCDIYAAASTPCIAAHSLVRRMLAAYGGTIFVIERTSDSTTHNVTTSSVSPYLVDQTGISTFCSGTTCNISKICDQISGQCSSGVNDLPQATVGNQPLLSYYTRPDGVIVPIVFAVGVPAGNNLFFRNRTNTTLVTGASTATAEYMVTYNNISSTCCGTYGNMESTVADTGNGHMFALSMATGSSGTSGTGIGPWPGADWENGNYLYGATLAHSTTNFTFARYNPTGPAWAVKSGDVTTGSLSTLYNSTLPAGYTAAFEGGLSLGEGGDGSRGQIAFLEGAITATLPTDASDNAVFANVQTIYGPTPGTVNCYAQPDFNNQAVQDTLAISATSANNASGAGWINSGDNTIANAADPFGANNAFTLTGTTGSQYGNFSQRLGYGTIPGSVAASTVYTFTDYIAKTAGATVFPAFEIQTDGAGGAEFAGVINTNTGAMVQGTWAGGTVTLSSTTVGTWGYKAKMIFTTTGATANPTVYIDGPIANSSGVRSNQSAGLTATHYCPTLQSGSH